jgi:hypothetical protein
VPPRSYYAGQQSMTKTTWIKIAGVSVALIAALRIVGFVIIHDGDGRTPEETIHLFLADVKKGEYAEAEKFWKPEELEKHKHFTWTERVDRNGVSQPSSEWHATPQSSAAFFRDNYLVDSYALKFEGIDKGYRWIYFTGMQNGRVKRSRFFVREIDGRWKLH